VQNDGASLGHGAIRRSFDFSLGNFSLRTGSPNDETPWLPNKEMTKHHTSDFTFFVSQSHKESPIVNCNSTS